MLQIPNINIMDKFKENLKSHNVYLYGAGNFGVSFYRKVKDEINICAFLDSKSVYKTLEGIEVLNPFTELIKKEYSIVIVTIFNREFDFSLIKNQLTQIGFYNIFSIIEVFPYFSDKIGDWFWLSSNTEYLSKINDIKTISKFFEDGKSREVFNKTIQARREFSYALLPSPDPIIEQYFSDDVPLNSFDNFVDCGAYNGDTLDVMIDRRTKFKKIYAFEPDLINFVKLSDKIKYYNKKAILYPCGVFSSNTIICFGSGVGEGSSISDQGNTHIQCVALDDILINELTENTYIKMDIEGSELEALKGGQEIIKNKKPDLAICLYHKPEDLIEIPLFLNTLGNYTYYLRQYGYYGMELVLYAINKH